MGKLDGKVAVITGGNSGIGLSTAIEFAREGAKVVISGRDAKTLESAAKQIGGDVLTVTSDVSRLSDIDKLMAAVTKKYGRIDVLFVNAGVARFAPIETFTETQFDDMVNINFKGAFFTVQKALPLLKKGASVIFTTSVANEIGMATSSIYAGTKAAVRSLARTLSGELLAKGIRVNAISPGPIQTPIFGRNGVSADQAAEMAKGVVSQVPLGRIGTSDEVAKTAVFLASSDSSFTLGAEIPVDGGLSQL
jgi:NAD(P)-dependent dehydrogenase (short-subunit alcohol dehydrogenase family)